MDEGRERVRMTVRRGEKGETRMRIRAVALELFAERGYEQTSLREIAERLGVTKAALYYHFHSKEDIVTSFFDDLGAEVDEIIAWGRGMPPTTETRRELLDRYAAVMRSTGFGLMRFVHENQPALRDLKPGTQLKEQFKALATLLVDPGAPAADQLRARIALFVINWGETVLEDVELAEAERAAVVSAFADELVNGPDTAKIAAG